MEIRKYCCSHLLLYKATTNNFKFLLRRWDATIDKFEVQLNVQLTDSVERNGGAFIAEDFLALAPAVLANPYTSSYDYVSSPSSIGVAYGPSDGPSDLLYGQVRVSP